MSDMAAQAKSHPESDSEPVAQLSLFGLSDAGE
jgi:hypothetical protein